MVNVNDDFRIAIENIFRRKIRSFLTILAIVIGIGSVVALIGIGSGLQNTIDEQFKMMGTNKLLITPSGGYYGLGSAAKLTGDDIDTVLGVRGIERADAWTYKLGRVEYNKKLAYDFVMGVKTEDNDFDESLKAFGIQLIDGKAPREGENNKAVVGCMLANDAKGNLFGKEMGIGKKFIIEGQEFQVSGAVSCVGNPQDDQNIYISIDTMRDLFNLENAEYDIIFAVVDDGKEIQPVADEVEKELRDLRDVKEGEEDFSVQTTEQLMETFMGVFSIVIVVIGGIGAISLLVGAVGIANTMFTSILERTREIGTMKAVGARNSDILTIIVFESGIFGLLGGAVGIAIGYCIAKIIGLVVTNALHFNLLVTFSPAFLIGLLLFSFLLGIFSGIIPAYRASKQVVVDALRYE